MQALWNWLGQKQLLPCESYFCTVRKCRKILNKKCRIFAKKITPQQIKYKLVIYMAWESFTFLQCEAGVCILVHKSILNICYNNCEINFYAWQPLHQDCNSEAILHEPFTMQENSFAHSPVYTSSNNAAIINCC